VPALVASFRGYKAQADEAERRGEEREAHAGSRLRDEARDELVELVVEDVARRLVGLPAVGVVLDVGEVEIRDDEILLSHGGA
jgi:hypothetical protein